MRYDALASQNIGFGRIDDMDDQARIVRSAEKSLAAGVIDRLAGQYRQMLGRRFEGGVDLSTGQWQKISLARAYMRDAQILILDEPTASLDARAEFEVYQRFVDLTAGKMAILFPTDFPQFGWPIGFWFSRTAVLSSKARINNWSLLRGNTLNCLSSRRPATGRAARVVY